AAGLLCLLVYGAATIASWSGYSWQEFGARPENVIPAGLALLAVPMVVKRRGTEDFSAVYRLIGLLSVFLALLILSNSGGLSYLPLRVKRIEVIYQLAGFAAAGLAIWLGISRHTAAAVNLGAAFFAILLLSRFVDWWWDWMPRYLFFLLIGAIAVLLLAVFHRLRARAQERRPV
ncbi:MAG: DUF2157 domain-containing protein, partial [Acidobacteria bacterium]|nr:DUF2157 domain-containing protein [Acidobacteriota bacterium]